MNIVNIHHACVANATYGNNGRVIYSNPTELCAVHKADLKIEYTDHPVWGSGQTLPKKTPKKVDVSMDISGMPLKMLSDFVGFMRTQGTSVLGNPIESAIIGKNAESPMIGLGYILDSDEPIPGPVLGDAYKRENRWYTIVCYKTAMQWNGITGQSWKDGEDPGDDISTVEFTCGGVNDEYASITKVTGFQSLEEAKLELFRVFNIHVNVALEINPDAEREEDRVVNFNLPGWRRVDNGTILELLEQNVINNRDVREFLIEGFEEGVNSFVPAAGTVMGRLIRLVWTEPENPENPNDQG